MPNDSMPRVKHAQEHCVANVPGTIVRELAAPVNGERCAKSFGSISCMSSFSQSIRPPSLNPFVAVATFSLSLQNTFEPDATSYCSITRQKKGRGGGNEGAREREGG